MKKLCILALTYKTFPASVSRVHQATIDVLTQMDLKVLHDEDDGMEAPACSPAAGDESCTSTSNQWNRGNAGAGPRQDGIFFADNAATELIARWRTCWSKNDPW